MLIGETKHERELAQLFRALKALTVGLAAAGILPGAARDGQQWDRERFAEILLTVDVTDGE